MGGVRLPRGNGEVVRLPRGSSLTDFAEKIDASSADLVKVLIGLGEMVTATQSIDDDTLMLLHGLKFLSTFDGSKGFWQIKNTERAKLRSAFICHRGLTSSASCHLD